MTVSPHDGEPPSKSQRKRDMLALQDLGEALVALAPDRLARITMPEGLRAAVVEAQHIRKFGALRRQFQYIGRLMREADAGAIREQLEALEGHSRRHTSWLHRVERWRDRLIAEEDALAQFLAEYPAADAQPLRAIIRNARKEKEEAKPPRAFRELFRSLRDIIPEPGAATGPATGTEDDTP